MFIQMNNFPYNFQKVFDVRKQRMKKKSATIVKRNMHYLRKSTIANMWFSSTPF